MEQSGRFQIFVENEPGGRASIRPSEIPTELIMKKFKREEVGAAAKNLINFFKENNDQWIAFSFEDLLLYYKKMNLSPNRMLFGLFGPWIDNSGFGSLEDSPYVIMESDGLLCITNSFIERIQN